jgi:mono/diheme cytochrome c family protein
MIIDSLRRVCAPALSALTVSLVLITLTTPSRGQTPSPDDSRQIEMGKEIFKYKANCQSCHKWDGAGDQGYGGIALSIRKTALNPEQVTEIIKCGRPMTGMPYFDQFAYTDKRCYDYTREDLGKNMPQMGEPLQAREVGAVVKYLFAKVVGRDATTYEECVDFWGTDTRQCEPYKK